MKQIISLIFTILTIFSMFPGCGCPSSNAGDSLDIKGTIKADAGGILTDDNRFSIDFSPGALEEDTNISVKEVDENDWPEIIKELNPEGIVIKLEPAGLQLNGPSIITLNTNTDDSAAIDISQGVPVYKLVLVSEDGDMEYIDEVETRVSADGDITVSGNITHFSWIVRQKSWLQVKMEDIDDEKAVDEEFEVPVELLNTAPLEVYMQLRPLAVLQTSSPVEITGRLKTEPQFTAWDSWTIDDVNQDGFLEIVRGDSYLPPNTPVSFGWRLKGTEAGTGVYTLHINAAENHIDNPDNSILYHLVLDGVVDIVKSKYIVAGSNGFYTLSYTTQKKVAAFSWHFEGEKGGIPPATKFVCVQPVRIPDGFRSKYDSGEALVERNNVDKKADNLYIPFDETGAITFSLATTTPGEYTFEVCGIMDEEYKDDESYQGNGDLITVTVPDPSEVSGLNREHEPNPGCHRGFDDMCITVKWHLFDDKSEIIPLSELGFGFPKLAAPDGREYSGLFLMKVERTMVKGHPYLPYQFEGTATSYYWLDRLSYCGEFGSGQTKCGYGDDGILYFTVSVRPWETHTISILGVADDIFEYKGTGDPVVITYPNEDKQVTVTYPD